MQDKFYIFAALRTPEKITRQPSRNLSPLLGLQVVVPRGPLLHPVGQILATTHA